MTDFLPLTEALEPWFDKPLAKLPKGCKKRVREVLYEIAWDELSAEQRRSAAREWDCQHDPASRSNDGYIPYPRAFQKLQKRLRATPKELAVWIICGPDDHGLAAYDPPSGSAPRRRATVLYPPEVSYLRLLMDCEFLESDIDQFVPKDRFITGEALIERWSNAPGITALEFIRKNIQDGRLHDVDPEWAHGKESFPAVEKPSPEGMFSLSEIKEIEKVDFGPMNEWEPQSSPAPESTESAVDERLCATPNAISKTPRHLSRQEVRNAEIQKKGGLKADKHVLLRELDGDDRPPSAGIGSPTWRIQQAKAAADARHDRPGGSRDKQKRIREIWATGKYTSRDRCAEEECAALDMSYSAARKALRNTADPTSSTT